MDQDFMGDENYDNSEREIKRRRHAGPLQGIIYDLLVKSHASKKHGCQVFPSGAELKAVGFPKPASGLTRREQFKHWAGRMDVTLDPDTKTERLIHRRTGKLILPLEEFESVIRKVHENLDGSHKDLKSTTLAIHNKYTTSNRDFGMTKSVITYVVDSCQKCRAGNKIDHVTNGSKFSTARPLIHNGVMGTEPSSMVVHTPNSSCVWFDKSVLLPGQEFYPKLRSFITELRGEFPAIAKGNREAKDRLIMKLYVVIEFIKREKQSLSKSFQAVEPFDQSLHNQVKELVAMYKAEGRTDKECDADMRLLVSAYQGYSDLFLQSLEASICLATSPTDNISPDDILYLGNGQALNFREGLMET